MKNLSYQHFMKVIHIKLWVTFLCIFIKTVDKYLFMYYNILINKKYIKNGGTKTWHMQELKIEKYQ